MRIRIGELRRIIRESLGGSSTDGLGILYGPYHKAPRTTIAVLFKTDKELVRNIWVSFAEGVDPSEWGTIVPDVSQMLVDDGVIVGVIGVSRRPDPREKCWGAWELEYVAGPGYGELLYKVGNAISSNNKLVPDRMHMRPKSLNLFTKYGSNPQPLDDVDDPKTADPNDDCAMYSGIGSAKMPDKQDILNMAYTGPEDSKQVFSELDRNATQFFYTRNKVATMPNGEGQYFLERAIRNAGMMFFKKMF